MRPERWCTCGRTQQANEDWAVTSSITTNGVMIVKCPSCGFDTTVREDSMLSVMVIIDCVGAWHVGHKYHYDPGCQRCARQYFVGDVHDLVEVEDWLHL